MENNKITVIIPARNEEKTIEEVIDLAKSSKNIEEIMVVNNNSTDRTEELAKKAGAEVIMCENQGKGYAMEKGIQYAKNEIIVFLDADVTNYPKNLVEILTKPLIEKEADFVKSTFIRKRGGIVTEVAVKPLLNILFPNIYKFSEPISGMIACKKSILENLELEKDYGVDIGILLDVINKNYKVTEVNIGEIENMSHLRKTHETITKMSTEITRAILKRAKYV